MSKSKGLYVDLDPELKRRLDVRAAYESRFKNELVRDALVAYLNAYDLAVQGEPGPEQLAFGTAKGQDAA
jgi:predicted transcriptional regulator